MELELEYSVFERAAEEFSSFLKNEYTTKVAFSGKYGAGKTTFLNCLFENPEKLNIKHNYEVFRVAPVNYSISSNNDIIDLIKYDIISQFLTKGVDVIENDIPEWQLLNEKDATFVIKNILSIVNISGVDGSKLLQTLTTLHNRLQSRAVSIDEGKQLIEFMSQIEASPGPLEQNGITKLIQNVINRISKDKVPILWIDDLDRLDPDHIFRILNVFSSHIDLELFHPSGLKNKFGFEKIIIVCDHENLQSLFHSRYGVGADFSGFFDKFYKGRIFRFDLSSELKNFVRQVLFKMDPEIVRNYNRELTFFGRTDDLLYRTIDFAAVAGKLTLRMIEKLVGVNVKKFDENLYFKLIKRTNGEFTVLLLFVNLYLFNGIERFGNLLTEMYSSGNKLTIDSHTHQLIVCTEKNFQDEKDRQIVIETEKGKHTYMREENGIWKLEISVEHPEVKIYTANYLQMDLLQHFIRRIKMLREQIY